MSELFSDRNIFLTQKNTLSKTLKEKKFAKNIKIKI